jgi:hypothetical protein
MKRDLYLDVQDLSVERGQHLAEPLASHVSRPPPMGPQDPDDGGIGGRLDPTHEVSAVAADPAK